MVIVRVADKAVNVPNPTCLHSILCNGCSPEPTDVIETPSRTLTPMSGAIHTYTVQIFSPPSSLPTICMFAGPALRNVHTYSFVLSVDQGARAIPYVIHPSNWQAEPPTANFLNSIVLKSNKLG